MNSHHDISGWLAITVTVGCLLLPVNSPGQDYQGGAGLQSGGGSQFNNGTLRSKSALGQLEEITGQKVQRSAPTRGMDTETERTPRPQPAPQPKPQYGVHQAFTDALKNGLADEISSRIADGILHGGDAEKQRAAQAATQAAAYQAQQEAIRQGRIITAQHYRADWDAREKESGQRLAGVFDTGGTAFFGQPNADAKAIAAILGDTGTEASPASDPEIVVPDTAIVQLLQKPTAIKLNSPAPPPLARAPLSKVPPSTPRQEIEGNAVDQELTRKENVEVAKAIARKFLDLHMEYAEDKVKEHAWELLGEGTVVQVVKEVHDWEEHRVTLTEKIGGIYTDFITKFTHYCDSAARVSASPRSSGLAPAEAQGEEVAKNAAQMQDKFNETALGEVK